MPYPDEIVASLSARFRLSESQQKWLKESLNELTVRSVVEEKTFSPEDLLILLATTGGDAAEVIVDDIVEVFVLSPTAAVLVADDPTQLAALHELALTNQDAFREWDKIRSAIQKIHSITSLRQIKLKKTLARELIGFKIIPFLAHETSKVLLENPIIRSEIFGLQSSIARYLNAHLDPLKSAAEAYFKRFFAQKGITLAEDDITFSPKLGNGVQLGAKMHISYRTETEEEGEIASVAGVSSGIDVEQTQRITYYIKTHQSGSTSCNSSVAPVDPKELFIYKVLEHMGYGPKAHFFFNHYSRGGFFIATQDVGFTKTHSHGDKTFDTYERWRADLNCSSKDPSFVDDRRQLIALDMLTRILRLKDATTNPDNFGVVKVEKQYRKWKLIDFRTQDEPDYYENTHIFTGFKAGNGSLTYGPDTFLGYILKNVDYQPERMQIAARIMREFLHTGRPSKSHPETNKMSLNQAMEKAFVEIDNYIKENVSLLGLDYRSAMDDVFAYKEAILSNIKVLGAGISEARESLGISADGENVAPDDSYRRVLAPQAFFVQQEEEATGRNAAAIDPPSPRISPSGAVEDSAD